VFNLVILYTLLISRLNLNYQFSFYYKYFRSIRLYQESRSGCEHCTNLLFYVNVYGERFLREIKQFFYSAEDGGDCVREGKFEAVDNFLLYSIIKAIIKM